MKRAAVAPVALTALIALVALTAALLASSPAASACVGMGLHPSLICRIDAVGNAKDDCARMLARQVRVRLEMYASDKSRAAKVNSWLASLLDSLANSPRTAGMPDLLPGRPFLLVWTVGMPFLVGGPGDDASLPPSLRSRVGFDETLAKIEMIPGSAIAGGFGGGRDAEIVVAVIPIDDAGIEDRPYAVELQRRDTEGIGGILHVDEFARSTWKELDLLGRNTRTLRFSAPNGTSRTFTVEGRR